MWKLAIEDDQTNKTDVNLVRDEYSIGRAEENTVRLTERNISRHHAKLSKASSGWVLADMNSYNGCFINGVRVSNTQSLEHGDLVQLGDYRLEVSNEGQRTDLTSAGGSRAATVPALPRSQSLTGQPDRLVMLIGPAPGSEYPLHGSRLVIGRGEECDVPINHSSVSRVHAEIQAVGDGRYEIIDRDSANGVRVNGAELKRSLIDVRDTIELGDVVLKFIPAGEIYRPGIEDIQQIASLTGRSDRPSPAPGVESLLASSGVSYGLKIVAGLVALGVLVVLGMVTLSATRPASTAAEPTSAPVDGTARVLAEAKALLDRGDVEAAHLKVTTEIAAQSNARQSPAFRGIEARWADSLFGRAAEEPDPALKRELFDQIAKSTSVDSVRRKRAANEITTLDAPGVDVSDLPATSAQPQAKAVPLAKPAPAIGPKPAPAPARPTAQGGGIVRKNPYDDPESSEPESSPKPGNAQDLATSGDRQKVTRAKTILQNKVNSGRASEQEVRMLRALCRQLGDSSCTQ